MDEDEAECKFGDDEETVWKCPDDGSFGFIPNTEDCQQYYICFAGAQIPMSCADGNHWSIEEETCMDEEEAECKFGDDDDREECPAEGVKSIAHPTSCEMYILCLNGFEFEISCPPGLHFSREHRICVSKELAQCDEVEKVWECPDDGSFGFIPNTEDCQQYYMCFAGAQIPMTCADGMHWSTNEDVCMDEDDAECLFGGGEKVWSCPDDGSFGFIPNTEDCQRYYICLGGNQLPMACGSGLHWSTAENQCMDEDEAECQFESSHEFCPETGIDNISHPDSCDMYILCLNGLEIEMHCAPGFHFSREFGSCVHPLLANCE